jgi:protein-L-isoaspartate(D-aspartate) O-methyltransferase
MSPGNGNDRFTEARRALLREIEAEISATADWTGYQSLDRRVCDALMQVPRHEFVPPGMLGRAYSNEALPIGQGQTISQPFVVALMTELLAIGGGDRLLEIGTGSGYQAAIASRLAAQVWSVEQNAALAAAAAERLDRLGYDTVSVCEGDGSGGWPDAAPYDRIIVTAQTEEIPPALISQLLPGGRIVLPLGGRVRQMLTLVTLRSDGGTDLKPILPVAFVPLV